MLRRHLVTGFSLIELLVGLAIVAMLLALGLPAFSNSLANAKIRASASAFHSSAQFARSEAIRLNGGVELILTADAAIAANVQTVVPSLTGSNVMVRYRIPGSTDPYTFLQSKSAQEGSLQSGGGNSVHTTASTATLVFDGSGATDQAAQATFSFTNPAGGACADAQGVGPMRCLNVRISVTGQTRLCDPVIAAGDSRACS